MDVFLLVIISALKQVATQHGLALIERGIQLIEDRIRGQATDEQIMQWLKDVQKGGTT